MEPVLFLIGFALVLARFLPWLGLRRKPALLLASACVVAAVGTTLVWWSNDNRARLQIVGLQDIPSIGRPGGYVSSVTCQSCHPSQYTSWHRSFHRTMTQAAKPSTVRAVFDGRKLETSDESFTVKQEGDLYWTSVLPREIRASNPASPLLQPDCKQIDMITGSHHMQVFWLDNNHGNLQLGFPFTWLNDDHRWVPRGDTFLRDPSTPPPMDVWNTTCLRCHSTAPQSRPDVEHKIYETRVAELGIACESCHGPAQAHVNANTNPWRRASLHFGRQPDTTITQPAHLDHVRSSQVCGNCHSMKWFDVDEEWRQNGFSYLPGQDLEKETPIIRPARLEAIPKAAAVINRHPEMISSFFWPDGMIRVSGREFNGLIESPCYQRGNLGCLSCHSMHQSDPVNQLALGMDGNEACLQCHEKMRGAVAAHTHHLPGSSGSLCYNCHMPYTTYGLLKGIRSHQIDSPSVQTARLSGRPDACSLCHLDRPLSWTAEHLTQWYGQKPVILDDDARKISAALLWLIRGDAGQRVLIAASMGRAAARQASGDNWMAPFLALGLEDPYAAVRYVAQRSLKQLPGYTNLDYDYVGDESIRATVAQRVINAWNNDPAYRALEPRHELLRGPKGVLEGAEIQRLLSTRDTRPVHLRE